MEEPQPPYEHDVSVIVINYNGGDYLARCLESLQATTVDLNVETIIVDNGSTDESLALLRMYERAGASVIWAGRNLGFSRANNIGAQTASGRYYLLLNNDCFLKPGSVKKLVDALDTRHRVAIVGPRLLNLDGTLQPSCHNFPVPLVLFLEQSLLWKLLRGIPLVRERLLIATPHDREKRVDWLAGACLLVRAEAYRAADGFDEDFFFYWEETDLCLRIKQQGWDVMFQPGAEAVHLGGGGGTNPALLPLFFKNLYLIYRKHYSPYRLVAARAIVRAMALVKAVRLLGAVLQPEKKAQSSREAAVWLRVSRL